MRAAALPGRAGQVGRDGLDQACVSVTGDQPHPGQPACGQVGEELVPRRPCLAGGHAQPQDLAVPVAVDAHSDQRDGVDHPSTLTDLHRQRVRGHERERPNLSQRAVAEVLDDLVQVTRHPRHLGLRQRVDPQLTHEFVHAASGHASEVAVRDHRDQGGLGTLAAFKEPLGEVGPAAQLRDRDVHGPDAGIEVAVAVAVALRRARRAGASVLGSDHGIGIRGKQRVDHGLQQAAHHVRAGFGQGFTQKAGRVDNVWCGHRDDSVRECCERFARRITRWPHPCPLPGPGQRPRYTTIGDSTNRHHPPTGHHRPYRANNPGATSTECEPRQAEPPAMNGPNPRNSGRGHFHAPMNTRQRARALPPR